MSSDEHKHLHQTDSSDDSTESDDMFEVETLEDAVLCVENKADIVMLDNMDALKVADVLDELEKRNIRQNSLI